MGQCVLKQPHSCGTRDALQVFEADDGSLNGYCFSCNTFVANPLGVGKRIDDIPKAKRLTKTKEEIAAEIEEIDDYPVVDLPERRLKKEALNFFGIKIGLSEEDGKTPKFHYYPYTKSGELVAYKVRLIENKRIWSIGNQSDVDLFGWEQAKKSGAKRLIITEGECDAVALRRILEIYTKEEFKDLIPAVCSLPHGAASAGRDIARLLPDLRKYFKEFSLAFDDDDAGKKAVEDVCKVLPDATTIPLPGKDANDCLINGKGKEAFKACTWNHKKAKNSRLVWGAQIHEAAKEPPVRGYSWPWKHIDDATKGIRLGETIYIGAGQKQGKSEVVNALIAHFITVHKWKVFAAKPEEANNKTYKMVAGKIAKKVFHDPDVEFDEEAYEQAGGYLKDNLCLVNLYQHLGWETLKADIYAAAGEGCRAIFIDPISNLTNGMEAGAANVKLQEIAQDLAAMALDLNVVIFLFCHLKNPESGLPHERGGKVLSSQFAGSRAMARSCNLMLGLEGNRDPDLQEEERNMRNLVLLEDRAWGNVGNFPLYWDRKTGMFNEVGKR